MPSENAEAVEACIAAYNAGDWDRAVAIMAPDVEWRDSSEHPDRRAVVGPDARSRRDGRGDRHATRERDKQRGRGPHAVRPRSSGDTRKNALEIEANFPRGLGG
jgi:ketosteroid isomerase-like protein